MTYEETFVLPVTPPFRLDLTVWTLRRRHTNSVDQWDGKQYNRVFVLQNKVFQVIVTQKTATELTVVIKSNNEIEAIQPIIAEKLRYMLGIDRKLETFYQLTQQDEYLLPLTKTFKGVKPPRFPTIFEALLNAIACQQITLDLGILLLNRLAQNYGKKFEDTTGVQYAFPTPEDFASVSEEEIKKLGFSYQKARTIINISQALVEKRLSFEDMEKLPNEEIVNRLTNIRGIGRWSAEYVLLRGFGRIDTFPGDDVGAQKNIMLLMRLDKRPDYEQIKKLTKKWNSYAGLVYFHLLLSKLQQKQWL